jgi:hypothetical protein
MSAEANVVIAITPAVIRKSRIISSVYIELVSVIFVRFDWTCYGPIRRFVGESDNGLQ